MGHTELVKHSTIQLPSLSYLYWIQDCNYLQNEYSNVYSLFIAICKVIFLKKSFFFFFLPFLLEQKGSILRDIQYDCEIRPLSQPSFWMSALKNNSPFPKTMDIILRKIVQSINPVESYGLRRSLERRNKQKRRTLNWQ